MYLYCTYIVEPNMRLSFTSSPSTSLSPYHIPIPTLTFRSSAILSLPSLANAPRHRSFEPSHPSLTTSPRHRQARPFKSPKNDHCLTKSWSSSPERVKLGQRWMEFQGLQNWEGLLDPLDDNLRSEILRYGQFVDAAYKSFDFDPSSPTYATCKFPKTGFADRSGLSETGYCVTRNLRTTSGIELPRWSQNAPMWVNVRSSWIGYVAVCQDKQEISRLGRRDVVIAYRGTATCLEWLENLRATLTHFPSSSSRDGSSSSDPMVENGFLSLYISGTLSLQKMVREEILRLLDSYGNEPLSLTITGHSLGAALAVLTAYDIKTAFKHAAPAMVTVISFGGPRVGNKSFRRKLEKQGIKVLRIVNDDDVITKVPGFVVEDDDDMASGRSVYVAATGFIPGWIRRRVEDTQWVYAEVGKELRLRSRDSPYVKRGNIATCHELRTYLHLVDGFVSSTCPFRATAN